MMADIWTILEITLSASLTAGLLLAVKALFRDKLDVRWHYLVWCVLLVRFAVPVRQKIFASPLSLFQTVPLPQLLNIMENRFDKIPGAAVWEQRIWIIYWAGVLALTVYDSAACLRLRLRNRQGHPASEKMRRMDAAVHFLIHLIRILNWFNPFLWYVLNRIQNDKKAFCAQRVPERPGKGRGEKYGQLLPKENAVISLCITLILLMACIGYADSPHHFEADMQHTDPERLRLKADLYDVTTPQEALNIYMTALQQKNAGYMALVLPDEEWEAQDFFFSELDESGRYHTRVLDFTQIDRDQYASSIGFYQESYEDVPKDWQIDLELYRDFDWQVRPVRIKALEDHSSAPKGLKPVMHAEAENKCWQVSLNCYNEVGFDALLFDGNQTEDAFAVDFDSRTRWLSAEIQYTGEENLTDRNLGIWVGSEEALKKREEEKIFPPNGNSTGSRLRLYKNVLVIFQVFLFAVRSYMGDHAFVIWLAFFLILFLMIEMQLSCLLEE